MSGARPTMPAPGGWRLGRRTELSQGSIAFDVFGTGPPVVLAHGTPTWSYLWRKITPLLAESLSVHVYDLLGYGASPASPTADVSVAAQARLLVELLDHWGSSSSSRCWRGSGSPCGCSGASRTPG